VFYQCFIVLLVLILETFIAFIVSSFIPKIETRIKTENINMVKEHIDKILNWKLN